MAANDLVVTVARFFAAQGLSGPGLVGVSGGMDSMVLLHAGQAAGLDLRAAHVNYGLRGEASDADEALVRAACAAASIPLSVRHILPETAPWRSKQAWARMERYDYFAALAAEKRVDWVAVAHHQQDQAETVLLQSLRGAGRAGRAGMRPLRPLSRDAPVVLVRPLLNASKADIEDYAARHAIDFRQDASNHDPAFRRARVRHTLLPQLAAATGVDVVKQLADEAHVHQGALVAWEAEREAWQQRAFGESTVSLAALASASAAWRGRLLLDALERFLPEAPRSRAVALELNRLVDAQVGRRIDFGAGTVWRARDALLFVPRMQRAPLVEVASLAPGRSVACGEGMLEATPVMPPPERAASASRNHCWLDADRVRWPLVVRHWQPGDRMQPLGMRGTKKVSDLLTEARWPTHRRAEALVVCSGGDVVWVPGVRRAEHARIDVQTRRATALTWVPE